MAKYGKVTRPRVVSMYGRVKVKKTPPKRKK